MDAHLPLSYFFVGADFSAEGGDASAENSQQKNHAMSTQNIKPKARPDKIGV